MTAVTIASWQSKGGVGKTSVTVQYAAQLALMGKRVLAVDWDVNNPVLAESLMTDEEMSRKLSPSFTSVGILNYPERGIDGIAIEANLNLNVQDTIEGVLRYRYPEPVRLSASQRGYVRTGCLHLIPSDRSMGETIIELEISGSDAIATTVRRGGVDKNLRLRTALEQARQDYDYIIIDCPPERPPRRLGIMNALYATDFVVMPLPVKRAALNACIEDMKTIEDFAVTRRKEGLGDLRVLGIQVLMYKEGTKTHANYLLQYTRSEVLRPYLLKSVIPFNMDLMDTAEILSGPPQLFDVSGVFAQSVRNSVEEVVRRVAEVTAGVR